jgi:hypothetical protein
MSKKQKKEDKPQGNIFETQKSAVQKNEQKLVM